MKAWHQSSAARMADVALSETCIARCKFMRSELVNQGAVVQVVASSRTPEGTPNYCPICKQAVQIEPSMPFGDVPCPHCGCLLWFIAADSDIRFYPYEQSEALRERVIRIFADVLGVKEDAVRRNPNIWNESGADSLDMIELVMELEEEFD
jgi:acyl carrier protein